MTDEVVDFLRQVSLFANLKTRDLRRVADLFERVSYDQDEYVTRQGKIGDRLYLVLVGRAAVLRVDASGTEETVSELRSGDCFGTAALFLDEPADATVRAIRGSTILSLERSLFNAFLDDYPAVRDALDVPMAIRARLEAPRFRWMTEDEVTLFFANKTRWTLFAAELVPAAVFLAAMILATFARNWRFVSTSLAFVAVIVWVGWTLVRWQDWRNDYYVVTNKRVLHHESRLPSLQVTVDQALLHQIQNVTLVRSTPLANLLNYGSVNMQTAGRHGFVSFVQLAEPERCQQIIFDVLEQQRALDRVSEHAAIRDALISQGHPREDEAAASSGSETEESTNYVTIGEAVWDLGEDVAPRDSITRADSRRFGFFRYVLDFLPRFRDERGGVITWYKHPFVLIRAILVPTLILAVTFAVGIVAAAAGWDSFPSLVLILFAVWCLSLFWLLWKYEDWRNDIFQMTPSHIVDIDRLPLGFRESRRQAALEQIQNINVDIPNIWARLFDYGNVVIETAGPAGDLTFEWVVRPRSVQAEVFQQIEAMRTRQRTEEKEHRRAELAEWFAVYNEMKEQGEI